MEDVFRGFIYVNQEDNYYFHLIASVSYGCSQTEINKNARWVYISDDPSILGPRGGIYLLRERRGLGS